MWKNVFKGLGVELQVKEDLWIKYCSFNRPHNALTHTHKHTVLPWRPEAGLRSAPWPSRRKYRRRHFLLLRGLMVRLRTFTTKQTESKQKQHRKSSYWSVCVLSRHLNSSPNSDVTQDYITEFGITAGPTVHIQPGRCVWFHLTWLSIVYRVSCHVMSNLETNCQCFRQE